MVVYRDYLPAVVSKERRHCAGRVHLTHDGVWSSDSSAQQQHSTAGGSTAAPGRQVRRLHLSASQIACQPSRQIDCRARGERSQTGHREQPSSSTPSSVASFPWTHARPARPHASPTPPPCRSRGGLPARRQSQGPDRDSASTVSPTSSTASAVDSREAPAGGTRSMAAVVRLA